MSRIRNNLLQDTDSKYIFLSMKDLEKLTRRKAPTIYRWIACGEFPAPVHLNRKSSAWRRSDYEKWAKSPQEWNKYSP